MTRPIFLALTLLIAATAIAGCTSTREQPQVTGRWSYTVYDTPQGDVDGTLILREQGDRLSGEMDLEIADEPVSIRNIERQGESVTFDARIEVDGDPIDTSTTVTAEEGGLIGQVEAEGYGTFRLQGTRSDA